MTFADKYANHAYADLIREAETQGIGLGVMAERERIIALLEAEHSEFTEQHQNDPVYLDDCSACFAIALIKGDDK